MIYGYNIDLQEGFSRRWFPNAFNETLELPNGQWRFLATAWDGLGTSKVLEGVLRCALVDSFLNGEETQISLNLTRNNCGQTEFGTPSSKDTSSGFPQPWALTFYDCMNYDAVEYRDGQKCIKGITGSYRVILPEGGSFVGASGPGLVSGCQDHSSSTADHLSSFRLPFFQLLASNVPFIIESFTGSGCTNDKVVYDFNAGHLPGSQGGEATALTKDNQNNIYLYRDPCSSSAGNGTPLFAYDDSGINRKLICNKNQMSQIAVSDNVVLGRDLDYQGAVHVDPIVNLDFIGEFDGDGHEIRNLNLDFSSNVTDGLGIFKKFGTSTKVYNINLKNISLKTSGSFSYAAGILVGVNQGFIQNIYGDSLSLDLNTGFEIGLLTGANRGNIDGVILSNSLIELNSSVHQVGGLFGLGSGMIRNVLVEGMDITGLPSANPYKVGGIGGYGISVSIEDVMISGLTVGSSSSPLDIKNELGAVLGYGQDSTIINAFVDGDFYIDEHIPGIPYISVGGVVGSLNGNSDISKILSNVSIDISNDLSTNGGVGGIIGKLNITSSGSPPNNFRQARYAGSISCVKNCGGLVGIQIGVSGKTLNISEGINLGNVSADSLGAGGIVGNGIYLNILDSVNRGNISNDAGKAGGIVGQAEGAVVVTKSINSGSISTITGHAGGLFGESIASGNKGERFISYGSVSASLTGVANKLVGTEDASSLTYLNVHVEGTSGDLGSTYSSVSGVTRYNGFTNLSTAAQSFNNSNGWGDVYSNDLIVTNASSISTTYEDALHGLDPANEKLGNYLSPFLIPSPGIWNKIEDNPWLMSSSFELANNLDFSGGIFKPIGSNLHCFSGTFFGNGRTLSNISLTETSGPGPGPGPLGVFRVLCGARIGERYDDQSPENYRLKIVNADFNSDTFDAGILAGKISTPASLIDEIIGVHISDSSVVGQSATGGLVGYAYTNSPALIHDVVLSNTSVESNASSAGGVIGNINAIGTSDFIINLAIFKNNGSVKASNSNVSAGGIIGYNVKPNLEISRSKVSNAIVEGASEAGGILGFDEPSAGTTRLNGVAVKYSTIDLSGSGASGGLVGKTGGSSHLEVDGSYVFNSSLLSGSGSKGSLAGDISGSSVTVSSGTDSPGNYFILQGGGHPLFGLVGGSTNVTDSANSNYYIGPASPYGNQLSSPSDIFTAPNLKIGSEFMIKDGVNHLLIPFELDIAYPIFLYMIPEATSGGGA